MELKSKQKFPLENRLSDSQIQKLKANKFSQDNNTTQTILLNYVEALEVAEKEIEELKVQLSNLRIAVNGTYGINKPEIDEIKEENEPKQFSFTRRNSSQKKN